MKLSRTMTVLLALIILIKSLNCVIGESQYAADNLSSQTSVPTLTQPSISPLVPLLPDPAEQGCTDSGCLCKGFVEAPEITVPEPAESLDDWRLIAAILSKSGGNQLTLYPQSHQARPGNSQFADTSPSGRALRHHHSSLTL